MTSCCPQGGAQSPSKGLRVHSLAPAYASSLALDHPQLKLHSSALSFFEFFEFSVLQPEVGDSRAWQKGPRGKSGF